MGGINVTYTMTDEGVIYSNISGPKEAEGALRDLQRRLCELPMFLGKHHKEIKQPACELNDENPENLCVTVKINHRKHVTNVSGNFSIIPDIYTSLVLDSLLIQYFGIILELKDFPNPSTLNIKDSVLKKRIQENWNKEENKRLRKFLLDDLLKSKKPKKVEEDEPAPAPNNLMIFLSASAVSLVNNMQSVTKFPSYAIVVAPAAADHKEDYDFMLRLPSSVEKASSPLSVTEQTSSHPEKNKSNNKKNQKKYLLRGHGKTVFSNPPPTSFDDESKPASPKTEDPSLTSQSAPVVQISPITATEGAAGRAASASISAAVYYKKNKLPANQNLQTMSAPPSAPNIQLMNFAQNQTETQNISSDAKNDTDGNNNDNHSIFGSLFSCLSPISAISRLETQPHVHQRESSIPHTVFFNTPTVPASSASSGTTLSSSSSGSTQKNDDQSDKKRNDMP